MKNKYYTPTKEEFYIGFEYELRDLDGSKTTLSNNPNKHVFIYKNVFEKKTALFEDFNIINIRLSDNKIRVKYLDRSDIEDLGFTIKTTSYGIYYIKGEYKIEYSWNKKLIISQQNKLLKTESFENEGNILFIGDVKNKSELKILLKQLNINN